MGIEVVNKSIKTSSVINSINTNNKLDNKDNNKEFKVNLEKAKCVENENTNIDDKTKARKEDIISIAKDYEIDRKEHPNNIPKLDTDVMLKVVDLHVEDNEKYYNNGKISIDKVAKDCGLSLDDISPRELNSIRFELKEEGVLDERTDKDLYNFIDRTYYNNMLNLTESSGYNIYDFRLDSGNPYSGVICDAAYSQKINCFEKCQYFIDIDKECGQFLSSRVMEGILDILKN